MRLDARRATVLVCGVAMFMGVMDTQIVNVALAAITRDFATNTASTQWVLTAYSLSLAVAMPASGWVGDRYGTKRTFLVAVSVFSLASGLCASADSLGMLIGLRILQGLGGGLLIPVGFAMMYRAYAPAERVRVARVQTLIMVLAPTSAPLIGGILVTTLSWRWVFIVNVPFGLAMVPFGLRYLVEYRRPDPGTYDPAGLLLGGPGLALVIYAITAGSTAGWGVARVWAGALLGAALIVCFVFAERRRSQPLLDLGLLVRDRLLRSCCVLQFLQPLAFMAPLVFIALYVQEARGFSPLVSGTTTVPEAIAIFAVSGTVARLYPRVGPRRLMAAGFALMALACALLGQLGADTSLWWARAWSGLLGLGAGFVTLPLQASAYAQVSGAETGHATALVNTAQRVGGAIGVGVLATVLTSRAGPTQHPPASAFGPVFLTAAGVAVAGVLIALRIDDRDALETMARRPA